ncbi:hypothetical protein NDU88_003371, partial [Pleurodeles waltl]
CNCIGMSGAVGTLTPFCVKAVSLVCTVSVTPFSCVWFPRSKLVLGALSLTAYGGGRSCNNLSINSSSSESSSSSQDLLFSLDLPES